MYTWHISDKNRYILEHFTGNAPTATKINVFIKILSHTPCPCPIAAIPAKTVANHSVLVSNRRAKEELTPYDIDYTSFSLKNAQYTYFGISALAVTRFSRIFWLIVPDIVEFEEF